MGQWIVDLMKWLFSREASPRADFESLYREWALIAKELKERNAIMEQRIDELEKEVRELRKSEDDYRMKRWEADRVIEAQRLEIQTLRGRVTELEAHVGRLEAQLAVKG